MSSIFIPQRSSSASSILRSREIKRTLSIEAFILFLGIFSSFYVDVIGQLYISEIILILLSPFLWLRNWGALLKDRLILRILLFGCLWFLSQVFTDLIRSTPINDMLRGWAGILVLIITFSSLYVLVKQKIRRIHAFLLGYIIGSLAVLSLQPPYSFVQEPWKFGFGHPTILLVLLIISYASSKGLKNIKKWVIPLLVLGSLSIYLNARALGAIVILTAFVLWLRSLKFGRAMLTHLHLKNILAGGTIFVLSLWGLSFLYGFAAQNGYLGSEAKQKYAMQSGGEFGILLGGRSEILASTIAIQDSPLIGHGSWARDPAYRLFLYRLIDLGYEPPRDELDQYINASDLIPTHSHFFQAWVWSGILGAVFWLVILGIILMGFIQSNRFPSSLYILVVYICVNSVWDIFFSPFGSIMRLRWAFRLLILITAYYQSQQLERSRQFLS